MFARLSLFALAALLLFDAVEMISAASWLIILAALAGWYAADMMSGAVHMYMDYKPCRPGIGLDRIYFYTGSRESAEYLALRDAAFSHLNPLERLIYDFKNHHPRPDALGRRSMMTQIGSTVMAATLPFAVLANLLFLVLHPPAWSLAALITFVTGATFAQYFHGSLHRRENPWPIRLMRRLGLLMVDEDHVRHHETLTCDFSTINGWSNPALNRVFSMLRRRGHLPDEGLEPR